MSSKRKLHEDADKGLNQDVPFTVLRVLWWPKQIHSMSAQINLFVFSVFPKSLSRKSLIELGKLASSTLATFFLLMGASQAAKAKTFQYHGLIDLDYGSSIIGAPRHSRYLKTTFTMRTAFAVLRPWECSTKS